MSEKRILCVGLVCLDEVSVVRSYPIEDTDQRSLDRYTARGGNASNSSTVLSVIGESVECFATLANRPRELELIREDFDRHNIFHGNCPVMDGFDTPVSAVIVNAQSGSRTIIHTNKNLPELTVDQFKSLVEENGHRYSWVHFEGRNKASVPGMVACLEGYGCPVSIEVEKVARRDEDLIPFGDVVMVSKDVARANGAEDMREAVEVFKRELKPGAKLVVPWGDRGAAGYDPATGETFASPAFSPPEGVVDSLGAGDAFNGALVGSLARGVQFRRAVEIACRVAGAKIGRKGFGGLRDVFQGELSKV